MKKSFLALASAALLVGVYSFTPAINHVAADTLTVNVERSALVWNGSVADHSHPGVVPVKSGTITVDAGKLTGGKFVLDVANLKSTDGAGERLDGHLKGADFLDAAKFPEATFEITSVKYSSATEAEIAGNLTVKGNTVPVKFPAYIRANNEKGFFAEAFFALNKSVLGIGYKAVVDDIHFSVKVSAKK